MCSLRPSSSLGTGCPFLLNLRFSAGETFLATLDVSQSYHPHAGWSALHQLLRLWCGARNRSLYLFYGSWISNIHAAWPVATLFLRSSRNVRSVSRHAIRPFDGRSSVDHDLYATANANSSLGGSYSEDGGRWGLIEYSAALALLHFNRSIVIRSIKHL